MGEKGIIGRGTWIDKVAYQLIEREKSLGRSLSLIRTESGLGASGIPHIGSMADAVRSHAVTLALRDMGFNSELIAFSDDMDGLRKVPAGMPAWLEEYLLRPVSRIPDPFGSYGSYAERMSGMLREALDEAGIEYRFMSGREVYSSGALTDIIHEILLSSRRIGEKIREVVGQDKFLNVLPYFPVCSSCGRIYTAVAERYDAERRRVHYRCIGAEVRGRRFEGCGHEGESDISKDDGKLSWKVEFAARWRLLDIRFEAYGKDIADSVKINDWVCREVLGTEPPLHVKYEMFLDTLGKKISKSTGNVFTPQMWYRYGSPSSLILLMLKRSVGTRYVSPRSIPRMMDELDALEDIYFGRTRLNDKFEEAKLKGLYEYSHNLRPPSAPSIHVPYRLLIEMALYAPPEQKEEFIASRLARYSYEIDGGVMRRIRNAINYAEDFGSARRQLDVKLSDAEREAVREVLETLRSAGSADEVQSSIFENARSRNIPPPELFRKLYLMLIGLPKGPRLGPFLLDLGYEKALRMLEPYLRGDTSPTRP